MVGLKVLHSSTRNRDDYSSFRLSAWCFNPRDIPHGRDIHVVEPPVCDILSSPGKPTLVYPVEVDGSSSQALAFEPPRINCVVVETTTAPFKVSTLCPENLQVDSRPIIDEGPGHLLERPTAHKDNTTPSSTATPTSSANTVPSMVSPTLMRFDIPADLPALTVGVATSASTIDEDEVEEVLPGCSGDSHCTATEKEATTPSNVVWRPAKEVLPVDLPPISEDVAVGARYNGTIYSRRPKEQAVVTMNTCQPTSPSLTDAFISQVTKPLQSALPTLAIQRRGRREAMVATKPPRCSRRIAMLPPEVNNQAAASVCRALGFDDVQTEATYDKYQNFWACPLIRDHAKVMATMIGKELPEDMANPVAGPILVVYGTRSCFNFIQWIQQAFLYGMLGDLMTELVVILFAR